MGYNAMNDFPTIAIVLVCMGFVLLSILWMVVESMRERRLQKQAFGIAQELRATISDAERALSELSRFAERAQARLDESNARAGVTAERLAELSGQLITQENRLRVFLYSMLEAVEIAPAVLAEREKPVRVVRQAVPVIVARQEPPAEVARQEVAVVVTRQPEAETPEPSQEEAIEEAIVERAPQDEAIAEAAVAWREEADAVAVAPAEEREARQPKPARVSRKTAEVLRYASDGMDESEIAKRLNIGRGEVSLILGLQGAYEKG